MINKVFLYLVLVMFSADLLKNELEHFYKGELMNYNNLLRRRQQNGDKIDTYMILL